MICGSLKNIKELENLGLLSIANLIEQAVSCANDVKSGKVVLVRDLVFANIDEVGTEEENCRRVEYHKEYLDVHIILKGTEKIGFRTEFLSEQDDCVPFDIEHDLGFLTSQKTTDFVTLKVGDFAIFAPLELHRPLCAVEKPSPIRKIVLKIHKKYLSVKR